MFEVRDPVSAFAVEQGDLGSSRKYTSLFVTGVRLHGFSQHHATFLYLSFWGFHNKTCCTYSVPPTDLRNVPNDLSLNAGQLRWHSRSIKAYKVAHIRQPAALMAASICFSTWTIHRVIHTHMPLCVLGSHPLAHTLPSFNRCGTRNHTLWDMRDFRLRDGFSPPSAIFLPFYNRGWFPPPSLLFLPAACFDKKDGRSFFLYFYLFSFLFYFILFYFVLFRRLHGIDCLTNNHDLFNPKDRDPDTYNHLYLFLLL